MSQQQAKANNTVVRATSVPRSSMLVSRDLLQINLRHLPATQILLLAVQIQFLRHGGRKDSRDTSAMVPHFSETLVL
jgi:hypothetical protein